MAALTLAELDQRSRALAQGLKDGKIEKDAAALRGRIEAGYAKVDQAVEDGAATDVLERAKAKIAALEDELARTERLLLIHYFEQAFLFIARDVLKFSSVPKDSRMRVLMPGVIDLTVNLEPKVLPF